MRQIVLDTETTGLELEQGHRVIEIGCVEIVNRRDTGRHFHRYVCPDREIDDAALKVHGIRREFLLSQPRFHQIAQELLEFIDGAELIIHNAAFDVAFLDAEMKALGAQRPELASLCTRDVCGVLDTLALARQMHPGQRNSLDALCKRYSVDNSHRDLHGALLDADLLLEVYLAMTGGQGALTLDDYDTSTHTVAAATRAIRPAGTLVVLRATEQEIEAHEALLRLLDKASGGRTAWRSFEPATPSPTPAVAATA